ncbi:MAG TPA: FtsX-like permease family protein [Candidatus Acidoferrales bacterium]|nr:FtsX-like permease family protein [Candidatus Acidoferrales bacterium]
MKLRDLTELAARNLREAVLRNSLTTLGIAVGVASLVAMLSLGVGLQELASTRLSRSGLFDAVFVTTQANMRAFGGPPRASADRVSSQPARKLDEEARRQLAEIKNVVEVYPEVRFPTEVQFEGKPYMTTVAGIPASARGDGAFDEMKGAFFSGPEANEAILQIEFARDLSKQTDSLIGKDLVLRYAEKQALPPDDSASGQSKANRSAANDSAISNTMISDVPAPGGFSLVPRELPLRIIGVVETEPATGFGGFGRGRLLIPLQIAQNLRIAQPTDMREMLRGNTGKPTYETLTVRVSSPKAVQGVEDTIKGMGFGTFSILDATKNMMLFFTVFDSLLLIFGSLALTVASLGIVNTLVMAILERRREIGILKALGAADRDVRRLFFVEAGAMGLLGGVLGVAMGWLIGRALTIGTNAYLKRQELPAIDISSIHWWMVALAIGVSFFVSLAAGMYPASRAARLNPVEALRYE